jgi:hypothetical protein
VEGLDVAGVGEDLEALDARSRVEGL